MIHRPGPRAPRRPPHPCAALRHGWCALSAVALVTACALQPAPVSSAGQATSSTAARVDVRSTPVALNPSDASQRRVGRFVYAGGVELEAEGPLRFGGLSDLDVTADGRFVSVTDEGLLVQGRLVLDSSGRLTGVADVTMSPLTGADGEPLREKADADAEGVTLLPDGDRLVSFERQHRIWRYGSDGRAPIPAPAPAAASGFPFNGGIEALAAFPAEGPRAYLAGSEGGVVWLCVLDGTCRETVLGSRVPQGFGLSAVAVSPDGTTVGLVTRVFDAALGVRVIVRLVGREAVQRTDAPLLDELVLVAPLTRDNFEGLAIVAGAGTTKRLYLLSDNNYSTAQRTYLLAFDWTPG